MDSMVTHERQKFKREKKKEDEAKAVKDAEGNVMEDYESHIIEFTPERTSLEENYMRDASESSENAQEDDGGIGEEDSDSAREQEELTNYATDKYHHKLWEKVCEAADGDEELEPFVQKTGESQSQKEVNEALGLSSADRDRLQKKLKRRIQKLS